MHERGHQENGVRHFAAVSGPDVGREADRALGGPAGQSVGRDARVGTAPRDNGHVTKLRVEAHVRPAVEHAQHDAAGFAVDLSTGEPGDADDTEPVADGELLEVAVARHAARVAAAAGVAVQQHAPHGAFHRRHPQPHPALALAVDPAVVGPVVVEVPTVIRPRLDRQRFHVSPLPYPLPPDVRPRGAGCKCDPGAGYKCGRTRKVTHNAIPPGACLPSARPARASFRIHPGWYHWGFPLLPRPGPPRPALPYCIRARDRRQESRGQDAQYCTRK